MKVPKKTGVATKAAATKAAKSELTQWDLRLYVAGPTAKSAEAFRNLVDLCEQHLAGHYHITVIDLLKNPQLAKGEQILAIPTVVRNLPSPIRKVIGSLSNNECVLVGLDLRARDGNPFAPLKKGTDV